MKIFKIKQVYDLAVGEADDALVEYFLRRYERDIKSYFPGFEQVRVQGNKAYVVCCDGNPAGVMLGRENINTLRFSESLSEAHVSYMKKWALYR